MSFPDAVRSALSQYVTFSGRARRSEYWWFYLFTALLYILAVVVDVAVGSYILRAVVVLALLLPSLAVGARRLHDTDRTAWWLLIGLVPVVGGIVLLVFYVMDSTPGENRFGPSPKPAPQGYGLDPAQP